MLVVNVSKPARDMGARNIRGGAWVLTWLGLGFRVDKGDQPNVASLAFCNL